MRSRIALQRKPLSFGMCMKVPMNRNFDDEPAPPLIDYALSRSNSAPPLVKIVKTGALPLSGCVWQRSPSSIIAMESTNFRSFICRLSWRSSQCRADRRGGASTSFPRYAVVSLQGICEMIFWSRPPELLDPRSKNDFQAARIVPLGRIH